MVPEMERIERDLGKLPVGVDAEFRRTRGLLSDMLAEEELLLWAREALDIGRQSARSQEAVLECFRASPDVARYLTLPSFLQWLRSGRELCAEAPSLAAAYFRAGPLAISYVRPRNIHRWAEMGRQLYKGTWNSTTLATRFFQLSPALLQHVPFWDVEFFSAVLELLSGKSSDLACECLEACAGLLREMGREREAFLSMSRAIAEGDWREMRDVLALTPGVMARLQGEQRVRFFRLAEGSARSATSKVSRLFREASRTLELVPTSRRDYLLDLCEMAVPINEEAAFCLLESLPQVAQRVTWDRVDPWAQWGVKLLKENVDSGLSYLRLESSTSDQALEALSSTLELERVRSVMRMYCRALAGEHIEIMSTQELADKGIGWVAEAQAATDGARVYLPPEVGRYRDKGRNFLWYKVVATHQSGHLEFGSFALEFDRPSRLFKDLRWRLGGDGGRAPSQEPPQEAVSTPIATDMGRFFALFQDRQLALDAFTVVEDSRVDYRIKAEYPGLASSYSETQKEALTERPSMEQLPLRQALMELLIRLSLDQDTRLSLPRDYMREATLLAKIASRLRTVEATVEDSAEAAIRVYAIISRLPNAKLAPEEWVQQDLDVSQEYVEEELAELLAELMRRGMEEPGGGREEDPYDSPEEVEFRGGFKPEMVQILNQLRLIRLDDLSREQLEELLKRSVELEISPDATEAGKELENVAQNLLREAGKTAERRQEGQGYSPIGHVDEQGGGLEATDELTFTYDEWDFRAGDYKPNWCMVRERPVEGGDSRFFDGVLKEYASLMADIRRQFELVLPERFRKVRRIEDGEDLELDAVIEAEIDRRSGGMSMERVYWRRNKVERDVAVAFLIDMSASTAEAIDEARHLEGEGGLAGAAADPAARLQGRRGYGGRRAYKRIIDLEKESAVLLIQALEAIGDTYGIYGFSGYGRENVEFYVVKDVNEGYSDKVKRRLDKVSPLHATRMGPAIRHATSKLESQEAKTKFLFLISDGRPQDRGYSREGVERAYAVHDTHMALTEARQKEITPFCLTVDRNGHDYLKEMCGDIGYEVLADIWALPRRLPMLYRKLTI